MEQDRFGSGCGSCLLLVAHCNLLTGETGILKFVVGDHRGSNNLQPYTSDAQNGPPLDLDVASGGLQNKRNKSPKWWFIDGDESQKVESAKISPKKANT